jgi:hypothetical protein
VCDDAHVFTSRARTGIVHLLFNPILVTVLRVFMPDVVLEQLRIQHYGGEIYVECWTDQSRIHRTR